MATFPEVRMGAMTQASQFSGRDLVSLADFSPAEIAHVLETASQLKADPLAYSQALAGKQIVLFFEKPSLRTRITFESGIHSLGGVSFFIDQTASRLGAREPLDDMAHNLERWIDGIVLRTYLHDTVTAMAKHASVPVINALSEMEHPCQALADLLTLREHFGEDLHGLRFTYVGDGNNVAHSLMLAIVSVGGHVAIATPRHYEPQQFFVGRAQQIAQQTGGSVRVTNDVAEAVRGVNAVYTDVWASMGQEEEAAERRRIFAPYQVNAELFALADKDAVFMHCLPAHRGDEVTAGVIDSKSSVVFDEAENRLHAQKAIMLLLLDGCGRARQSKTL
jgi:ornithine carbamoyltransferase